MVYLPTFTIKINQMKVYKYTIHGSYGLFSSFKSFRPLPGTFISVHSDSQKDAKLRVIPPITSGSLEKRVATGASGMGSIFDVGTLYDLCPALVVKYVDMYIYIYSICFLFVLLHPYDSKR